MYNATRTARHDAVGAIINADGHHSLIVTQQLHADFQGLRIPDQDLAITVCFVLYCILCVCVRARICVSQQAQESVYIVYCVLFLS